MLTTTPLVPLRSYSRDISKLSCKLTSGVTSRLQLKLVVRFESNRVDSTTVATTLGNYSRILGNYSDLMGYCCNYYFFNKFSLRCVFSAHRYWIGAERERDRDLILVANSFFPSPEEARENMSYQQNFRSYQMLNSRLMDLLFHYYFQLLVF